MEFVEDKDTFTIVYDFPGRFDWIRQALEEYGKVTIGKAFTINRGHVIEGLDESDEFMIIKIGVKRENYWEMDCSILGLEYELYLGIENKWKPKHFIAEKGVSIFPKLNGIVESQLWIGGKNKRAMPFSQYDQMVRKLPSYTELNKYVRARLSGVVGEYFDIIGNAQRKYENYLNKKLGKSRSVTPASLSITESAKFDYLISKLSEMLDSAVSFPESAWQSEIINIIRLLFPKYALPVEKVQIKDTKGRRREIDIGLIDVEGNLDIVEIKKPFDECIMSKSKYRDNHVPLRELSGAIMQAEKYILYLQRGGPKLDEKIQKQFSKKIPRGLFVKIVNPKAIIIMGRSNNLTKQQQSDFEVVKRKFKNIADIITYDDMLGRLKVLREAVT